MPFASAKRRALSERNRERAAKRWKKEEERDVPPESGGASASPPDFSVPHTSQETAASYRHSLLQEEEPETFQRSDSDRSDSGMTIISLLRLKTLLSLIKCECGNQVSSKVTTNYFDCVVSLTCEECETLVHHSEPDKCKNSDLTDGNVTHVYHSLSEGYGRAGLSRLTAALGVAELTTYAFTRHVNYIYREMDTYYKQQESVTKQCVDKAYEQKGKERDNDGKLNSDVSFDGTWMTRGHKSHVGAAFVMDLYSGMVLDFEVLSNFCKSCVQYLKKKGQAMYDEWYKTVHAGKCQSNFSGLSGAMEREAAVRMWNRSEDKGYRYVTFLSDGDSSSYTSVCNINNGNGPYANHSVVKEECINHVQKRMGTRLRKLKDELKEDKTTKAGKVIKKSLVGGKHQLTDKQINAFQSYYGKAIRDSVGTSIMKMKLKIMSGFWHAISRDGDGNHHHIHCDSAWCFFKKAKDEGKPIPSHDTMRNYLRLEKKYEDRVREVFYDLSSPALLERCLRGQSQNRNESLHSKLWHHHSKAKFAGLRRVKFVTQLTVLDHNFGYVSNRFLQHLGISLTPEGALSRKRMDKKKVSPLKGPKKSKKKSAPGPDYQPGNF